MPRFPIFSAAALVVCAVPTLAQPDDEGFPHHPPDITCGKLTAHYKVELQPGGDMRARLRSRHPQRASLELDDGRVFALARRVSGDRAFLVSPDANNGNGGIVDALDDGEITKNNQLAKDQKIDLEVVDRITLEGTIKKGNAVERIKLVRTANPPRTAAELAQFDAGPAFDVKALFESCPPAWQNYFPHVWSKFGPLFYRGRLDRSARVMLIGSDPGPTECLPYVRRGFVGDSGQRVQGVLAKLGLTRSYVCMNAFAFAFRPSHSDAGHGEAVHTDPAILAWRNRCFSRAVGPQLQAVVCFGFQSKRAWELWSDKPNVPMIYLPHPSRFNAGEDPSLLNAYRRGVERLRQLVTPDDEAVRDAHQNYGPEFTEFDFEPIPRGDLPRGGWIDDQFVPTPAWLGDDSWTRALLYPIHNVARRPSPDPKDEMILTSPDLEETRIKVRPHPTGNPMKTPRFVTVQ